MKGVKKKDEKEEVAKAVRRGITQAARDDFSGLLDWSADQHFKYWEEVWDKQLASEQLASEQAPILPFSDNGGVSIVD